MKTETAATIKSLLVASSVLQFAFAPFDACAAAKIDQVIVRQQWPWSTDVKVEYKITGVTDADPVNIQVAAADGDTPLDASNLSSAMKGDLFGISKDGSYSFVIDPVAAFGKANVAIMNFNVSLTTTPSAANMSDVLYKVVDLDTGAVTDITRADFYGNKYGSFETSFAAVGEGFTTALEDVLIWTEVTNNPIYKTDKLVLRKIPAASWGPWMMDAPGANGSSASNMAGSEHLVKLTADYYMGVFPITQAQCAKIRPTGSSKSWGVYGVYYTNVTEFADHLHKPATGIQWYKVRSSRDVDAVTNNPDDDSICGIMSARTANKLLFDLPTEAQWEFAARGGVTNASLYSGKSWTNGNIYEVAWTVDNILASSSSLNAGYDKEQTVTVGRKPPNAFGLYDILGNVNELCRDYTDDKSYAYTDKETPEENPKGVAQSAAVYGAGSNSSYRKHIYRGGAVDSSKYHCSVRSRFSAHENQQGGGLGFRVICTVP